LALISALSTQKAVLGDSRSRGARLLCSSAETTDSSADEAAILTELCLRSKAVWGCDKEFMEACRDELTLTPSTMQSSHFKVAEIGRCLIGMAQVTVKGDTAELDKLHLN
jgi:hypothetical protein